MSGKPQTPIADSLPFAGRLTTHGCPILRAHFLSILSRIEDEWETALLFFLSFPQGTCFCLLPVVQQLLGAPFFARTLRDEWETANANCRLCAFCFPR